MKRPLSFALFAIGTLCAALPGRAAAPLQLKVDHEASEVSFQGRATMHSFDGRIEKWDLDLTIPENAEIPDSVVFRGDGLSMTTDHKKRDEEMHHWLEHQTHPAVEFRLRQFTGSAQARQAEGDLTVHGVTRAITMPVWIKRDGSRLTVTGDAVVDTANFGLPQFRKLGLLTVGREVKIHFMVTGQLE